MKKYFLLLIAVVVLSAGFAVSDKDYVKTARNVKRSDAILFDDISLAENFPANDFKEYEAGDKVFFKPKVRLGEVKKLCDDTVVKGVSDLRNGQAVLVLADRIWVRFVDHDTTTHTKARGFLKDLNSEIVPQFYATDKHAFSVTVPESETIESFVQKLNGYAEIDYAEYQPINYTYYTPTDPGYSSQWHWTLMNMEDAWNITTGSSSVILVVNDSGVSLYTNADAVNTGNISPSGSYIKSRELQNVAIYNNGATVIDLYNNDTDGEDDFGHGTFIANMMFGDMNDGQDGAGMAPGCMVAPYKAGGCGGTLAYGTNGMDYGTSIGALAVNCSYGGPSYSATTQTAVTTAWNNGTVIVVASGNDGTNDMGYPAGYNRAFAVGATTSTGSWWSSSNWDEGATGGWQGDKASDFSNTELDQLFCVTPSANMYGTDMQFSNWNGSGYDCATADPSNETWGSGNYGTSYSCPSMVGLIGLMGSAGTVDPATIIDILGNTADHTSNGNVSPTATSAISGATTYDWKYGHGLLDANAALLLCSPAPYIAFDSKTASDATGGDNDGIVEAGETIQINVTLRNDGPVDAAATLTNGAATITTDDYWTTITDDASSYGNIAGNGGTAAALDTMEVVLHSATPNMQEVEFSLYITGKYDSDTKDYSTTRTFRMTVGSTPMLIVDVDSGATVNGYTLNSEDRVIDALTALNWSYEMVSVVPTDLSGVLAAAIFVLAGNVGYADYNNSATGAYQLLSISECNILVQYIENGGGVYMEGSGQSHRYASSSLWPKFGTDADPVDFRYDHYAYVDLDENYPDPPTTYRTDANVRTVSGSAGCGANLGTDQEYENYVDHSCGQYTNSFNTPLSPTDASTAVTSSGLNQGNVTRVVEWNIPGQGYTIFSDILFAGINTTVDPDANRVQYMDDILNFLGETSNPSDNTDPAITSISAEVFPLQEGIIELSWPAPGDDGWEGWNSGGMYDVEYKKGAGGTWTDASGEPTPPKRPYKTEYCSVSGLTVADTYYFRIRTEDGSNWSNYSRETLIYLPGRPSSWTSGTFGNGEKILIWEEGSFEELGYSQLDADAWNGGLGQLNYPAIRMRSDGDIGDLKTYDVVLYVGGACNHSNHQSYIESIPTIEDYLDNATSPNFYAEGMLWLYKLAVSGVNPDHVDNYTTYASAGVALTSGNTSLTGLAGTHGASASYPYTPNTRFGADYIVTGDVNGSAVAFTSNGGANASNQTSTGNDRIFTNLQCSLLDNVTDEYDYVYRVMNWFGYSGLVDVWPPNSFELEAALGGVSGSVKLDWTAPGDNELIVGGAGVVVSYDIKYSLSAFTEGNFAANGSAIGQTPPSPLAAGNKQFIMASSYNAGTEYHFMIKATDDEGFTSYSNNASIRIPSDQASPRILVFDASYGGLDQFYGAAKSMYDGVNDSGQLGDRISSPFVRALANAGYSFDYIIDETINKGPNFNIDVLPSLSNYDIVCIFQFSQGHAGEDGNEGTADDISHGFSENDQAAINTFIRTQGKRLFFEDQLIIAYQYWMFPSTIPTPEFWDMFGADIWDIWADPYGHIQQAEGIDNGYDIAKGMKFNFDHQSDLDYWQTDFIPSWDSSESFLVANKVRNDSSGITIDVGVNLGIANWDQGNDIKTVCTGTYLAGLTPRDDVLYYNSTYDNLVK
ncbi:hypothetical protein KAU32_06215, partial [bacterium]|nr:hypothetical protein [bacterium]